MTMHCWRDLRLSLAASRRLTTTGGMDGSVPGDIPGASPTLGTTVSSAVDTNTKPRDVCALELTAVMSHRRPAVRS